MKHKMFWFFVQSLWKRDSWTSKMTTKMFCLFLHRGVEICDLRGNVLIFCAKPVKNCDLRDRAQNLSPVVGCDFGYPFLFKARGNLRFQKFHWTSEITTFWTRSPSVSCDSTVLFQFRTDIPSKLQQVADFHSPCTKKTQHFSFIFAPSWPL